MATETLQATDQSLEVMFGIELDGGAQDSAVATAIWSGIKCRKCGGTGNFVGWSGKVVGKCFACKGAGVHVANVKDDTSTAIDVTKIQAAITTAFENGQRSPRLHLGTFCFSRAPDYGKNPGAIYVKDGEQYLGKIIAGRFNPVKDCTEEQKASIISVAADPYKAATDYGFRTGVCSCCHRTLTNAESIERGIGPICAEKYGW